MIVVFTSNSEGGVVQFAIQISNTLMNLGQEVFCYLPEKSIVTLGSFPEERIKYYKKHNTINILANSLKNIADEIAKQEPDIVWFVDEAIICSQISILLKTNKIVFTIHDPLPHPTNRESLRQRVHDRFAYYMRRRALRTVSLTVLLSNNSLKTFLKEYNYKGKYAMLPLGAHIPSLVEERPIEIEACPFFLFFGRIDKYKNISTLIQAYIQLSEKEDTIPLVIAGKGKVLDNEMALIENNPKIVLINRYISDQEMVWLFAHSNSVILPYIEATQSGVIPIAYYFGVPVITSNVTGLTEFVEDGKTGIICNSVMDYSNSMMELSKAEVLLQYKQAARSYYLNRLDWKNNIQRILDIIQKTYK